MERLSEIISLKNNDYSELEQRFSRIAGDQLVGADLKDSKNYDKGTKQGYSVIIPSYHYEKYLRGLLLSLDKQDFNRKFEVIVVNDSPDSLSKQVVSFKPERYDLKIIELKRNFGRAYARNVGIANANGEILSFVDSDMILPSNFARENYYRVALLPNVLLTGFYQNSKSSAYSRLFEKVKTVDFVFNGDFHTDSRYEKVFTQSDVALGYNITEKNVGKQYTILYATDNFKSFGFGKRYSVWSLSTMVMGGLLTTTKKMAIGVGGFDLRFKGWGLEDTYFGAKLIAAGTYIVPTYNVVPYRIKQMLRRENQVKRLHESKENLTLYKQLLDGSFDQAATSKTFKEQFVKHKQL